MRHALSIVTAEKSVGVTVTRHGLQSETSAHHSGSWTTCPQCAEARRQDCSQKAPAPLTCHPLSSRTPSRTIHFRCQRPTCVHKLGAIADSGSPDSATPASLLSLSFPILPQWRFLDSAAPPCVRPRLLLSPPLLSQIMDQMSGLKSNAKSNASPPGSPPHQQPGHSTTNVPRAP